MSTRVRRTNVEMLVDALMAFDLHRASERRLGEWLGWDADKTRRVVDRACADPALSVQRGPGGVVKFLGSERSGTSLYGDVRRVVANYWARNEFGARETEVYVTARQGKRGTGQWTHPDLVGAWFPRRRPTRSSPKLLHAIEVEARGGFNISSVYQAHAQARGADYAWVFTFASEIDDDDRFERIQWAARTIGVGIVQFERPGASSTYRTIIPADRLEHDYEWRLAFVNRVLDQSEDSPLMESS